MSPTAIDTDLRWGVRAAAQQRPVDEGAMSTMSPPAEEVTFLRLVDNSLIIDIATVGDESPLRLRTRVRRRPVPVETPQWGGAEPLRVRDRPASELPPVVILPYPLDEAYVSPPPVAEAEPVELVLSAPRRVIAFARAGEGAITPEPQAMARVVDTPLVPSLEDSTVVSVETIDPRMSARRADVEDGRRRGRYRNVASVLVAATLLGGAVVAVLASPLLQLRTVTVHGGTEIGVNRVRTAAGLRLGQSMLDVNVDQVRRLVTELPLVERVTVRRQWPRTVVLDVVEAVPVAAVATGDTWSVVDRRGTVLETRPVQPSLPTVELETGANVGSVQPGDPRIRGALVVASLMSAELRQQVARVAVRGTEVNVWVRRSGVAKVRRGPGDELLVLVGDPRDLPAKVRALDTMLAGADLANAAVLDLTVPDQPIVTHRVSAP